MNRDRIHAYTLILRTSFLDIPPFAGVQFLSEEQPSHGREEGTHEVPELRRGVCRQRPLLPILRQLRADRREHERTAAADRGPGEPAPPQVVEVHHWHETERTVYIRESSAPAVSPRRRAVSLLLCAFLGGVWAHKFYEGKIGLGILYLLTLGLFGAGIFVDLLRLLLGHPVDGNGLPIRWR